MERRVTRLIPHAAAAAAARDDITGRCHVRLIKGDEEKTGAAAHGQGEVGGEHVSQAEAFILGQVSEAQEDDGSRQMLRHNQAVLGDLEGVGGG